MKKHSYDFQQVLSQFPENINQQLENELDIFMMIKVKVRGALDIISGRISGPDSEIISLSGIRQDISNIQPGYRIFLISGPDTGYFFQGVYIKFVLI